MTLPDDAMKTLARLQSNLNSGGAVGLANRTKRAYYRGEAPVRNLGIAIPENLVGVAPVVGWPSTVVDSIAERVDFLGFSASGDHGDELSRWVRVSRLRQEFSKAVTDSLIYGVGFLEIRERASRESVSGWAPTAKAVDPMSATFVWNDEGTEVAAGLVTRHTQDGVLLRTLYLPDETWFEVFGEDGAVEWSVDHHGRGVAALVPIPNRVLSGSARGHSEITDAIRYLTDHGIRTMLGMEYNREFYTAPQRYVENAFAETVGLSEENSKRENRMAAWNASQSSFVAVPPTEVEDDNGDVKLVSPKVGQFASSPPTPYIDEMKMLTQMVSAETGIPVEYLGFVTDNPSSAEAIRAKEFKLVKKAELKHRQYSDPLTRIVAPLLWHIAMGERMSEDVQADLDCLWRDPATPTLAAMADATSKMIASGQLPPRGSVTAEMSGFTPEQQRRLEADWARDTSRALVGDLADRAE